MILVNGKLQDTVSVNDRGFTYGDGLFETIAIIDGKMLLWDLHWHRLVNGCERLRINCPEESLLLDDIEQLLAQANDNYRRRGVIKLIVTRGVGGRGYQYDPAMGSTRLVMLSGWPPHQGTEKDKGIKIQLCDTRLSSQPRLAGIKHLNRLEQVLARSEWSNDEITEGVMLDANDNIIEGTMSNLFFVDHQQCLVTPSLNECGIAGVQREHVLNKAEEKGYQIKITEVPVNDLDQFSEVFVTNSLIGIWPVIAIEDQRFVIGPVTKSLQAAIND
jgi:4-amino-4-deoxychorismate lyase